MWPLTTEQILFITGFPLLFLHPRVIHSTRWRSSGADIISRKNDDNENKISHASHRYLKYQQHQCTTFVHTNPLVFAHSRIATKTFESNTLCFRSHLSHLLAKIKNIPHTSCCQCPQQCNGSWTRSSTWAYRNKDQPLGITKLLIISSFCSYNTQEHGSSSTENREFGS